MLKLSGTEKTIIGTVLVSPGVLYEIEKEVNPIMFQGGKDLANLIWEKHIAGENINIVTIAAECELKGIAKEKNVLELRDFYDIHSLSGAVSVFKDEYLKRNYAKSFSTGLSELSEGVSPNVVYDNVINECELTNEFFSVKDSKDSQLIDAANYLDHQFDDNKFTLGHETPLPSLNEITGGLEGGNFIVWGGRPHMGKTTTALFIWLGMALTGISVAIFSFEMSARELWLRLACFIAEIPYKKVKGHKLAESHKKLTDGDKQHLYAALSMLQTKEIYIYDSSEVGPNWVLSKSKVRSIIHKKKIKLVGIDHIHLMNLDGKRGEQEIASISGDLKTLATTTNSIVFGLGQLNRYLEIRGGAKIPQMSDLRGSGALEQDADYIGFVYRPEYYNINEDEEGVSLKGITEIITAKNRIGEILKNFYLRFNTNKYTFSDLGFDRKSDFEEEPEQQLSASTQFPVQQDNVIIKPTKVNDDDDIPF